MSRARHAWLLFPLLLTAGLASAAEFPGVWQGTLKAGQGLRLVFRITAGDAGALTATVHSLDQGGQAFPATVTLQGSQVKVTLPSLGASFEGRLNAEGTSIAGTWSQSGMPFPLSLDRATPASAWSVPEPPARMGPMATDAPQRFEVAAIKPSRPEARGKVITVKGRQVITMNTTASDLITFAYDVHASQIGNGPPWLTSDHFDVTAQPEAQGQPTIAQLKGMVRALLADRFKLASHTESRELPVYALVVSGASHKLTPAAAGGGSLPSLMFQRPGVLPARNASTTDLASVFQNAVLDRPVLDRTGLAGQWDFTLTWTPDESQFGGLGLRIPPAPADGSGPPGLFTAIQEQLGLKLDATTAAAPVMVLDHIEPPSAD